MPGLLVYARQLGSKLTFLGRRGCESGAMSSGSMAEINKTWEPLSVFLLIVPTQYALDTSLATPDSHS